MKVSASFLSIDEKLKENIQKLILAQPDYLHLDIMDGIFVPKKTWMVSEIKHMIGDIKLPLDIHFMVKDVVSYIKAFSVLEPEYMTFHIEAVNNAEEIISLIHDLGCKAGITLNPNTPLETILPYLHQVEMVLVMSVEAGSGGQHFIKDSQKRIMQLYEYRSSHNLSYQISVDGGINDTTMLACQNADILVAGSYITNHDNYQAQIEVLRKLEL